MFIVVLWLFFGRLILCLSCRMLPKTSTRAPTLKLRLRSNMHCSAEPFFIFLRPFIKCPLTRLTVLNGKLSRFISVCKAMAGSLLSSRAILSTVKENHHHHNKRLWDLVPASTSNLNYRSAVRFSSSLNAAAYY